jgi:putative sigma-54 modulation protein
MKLPLQISFKNLAREEHIVQIIKEKAAKLDRLSNEIIQTEVTVSVPHRSHKKGNFYNVRIDISVPGKELVVNHEDNDEMENKDIHHVLKATFDAAYRQLEDYTERRNAA